MARILVFLIRCYQILLSPFLGRACRFFPSCSQYAIESIETYGTAKGSLMAIRRIARCRPGHTSGYDPVR